MAGYQWFEIYLKGKELDFPETAKAKLMLKQSDGIPVFFVKAPSSKLKIKRVEMYYTNDGDVKKRLWTSVTPESDGKGIWSIQTPVSDRDKPLFAFANFICEVEPIKVAAQLYNGKSEMCVTSEYAFAWPEELKAAAVKVTTK